MLEVLNLYKKVGETPLERLERFKFDQPQYKGKKMTYAGRLDPMAEGVMIVLSGNKIIEKEKFLSLDKEYEFEVLFGFETDTFDVLGKVIKVCRSNVEVEKVRRKVDEFCGRQIQEYPPYSSKSVSGRSLFEIAREGNVKNIELPQREIEIYESYFEGSRKINSVDLFDFIEKRIKLIKGDFRQEEIIDLWKKELSRSNEYLLVKAKIVCSSGTYVRRICNDVGKDLNSCALAFSIKRTRVGDFGIEGAVK